MVTVTLPQACRAVGAPYDGTHKWYRHGVYSPAVRSRGMGKGREQRLTLVQALGLGVATALRRRGVDVSACGRVIASLEQRGEQALVEGFGDGYTHLVLLGDQVFVARPDATLEFEARGPVVAVVIDIARCWAKLLAALREDGVLPAETKTETVTA